MSSTPTPSKPDTLYPKISGSHKDLLSHIAYQQHLHPELSPITSIPLTGTVKLHGMHADIVINHTNEIRLQSRNMHSVTLTNDIQGFAARMLPLTSQILSLKSRIHTRFLSLNPDKSINPEHPLIIAGEWIGPGVQKKVAISSLPEKLFVIISININDVWVPDEPYGDISSEVDKIYHISHSGFYHHDLPLSSSSDAQASLESLQPLADEVERECPFGKKFGIVGLGEGIVWKPAIEPFCHEAKAWVKMKGPISKGKPVGERKKGQGSGEYVKEFVGSVVGEMRFEQGWQYLEEMGLARDRKGVVGYLKWLVGDVSVEEGALVREMKVDFGAVKREVERVGRDWYFRKLKEVEENEKVEATVDEVELKVGKLEMV